MWPEFGPYREDAVNQSIQTLFQQSLEDLEKQKIAHEIRAHDLAWYKRPGYAAAIAPLAIAAISLAVSAFTDFRESAKRIELLETDVAIEKQQNRLLLIEAKEARLEADLAKRQAEEAQNLQKVSKAERDAFSKKASELESDVADLLESQKESQKQYRMIELAYAEQEREFERAYAEQQREFELAYAELRREIESFNTKASLERSDTPTLDAPKAPNVTAVKPRVTFPTVTFCNEGFLPLSNQKCYEP